MYYQQYQRNSNIGPSNGDYYFHNIVGYYPYQYFQQMYRQQQINPQLFMDSAKGSQKLLNDANKIIQKIANDHNFAHEIMVASHQSQLGRVEQLISSIGISSNLETWFNPDGIRMELVSDKSEKGKSTLILSLNWQQFPHYV